MKNKQRSAPWRILQALCIAALTSSAVSCGEDGLAAQCGLTCPAEGVLQGNASISGLANVDAFFGAVVGVRDASLELENAVRAELQGMAALLEVQVDANASLADLSAQVKAALDAKLAANVDGGLTVRFQEPLCEADVEVTARATAECDAQVDPGAVQVACEGKCQVSAEVAAECAADARLECRGQAPALNCTGSCQGSCQLNAAATCEGTCNGTCNGTCSVTDATGNCAGQCDGTCQGRCELSAGGTCSGSCEGECTYTPASGSCEAGAQATCDFRGQAEAKCEGSCEGEVRPPSVSAECEASVDAKAKAEIQCTPPELVIEFQFAAGLDANAQAEFRAFLGNFRTRFAALLAARSNLRFLAQATGNLGAAAQGAVQESFNTALSGNADLKATIGLGCAISELDSAVQAVGEAGTSAEGSISAIAQIGSSVGVS